MRPAAPVKSTNGNEDRIAKVGSVARWLGWLKWLGGWVAGWHSQPNLSHLSQLGNLSHPCLVGTGGFEPPTS